MCLHWDQASVCGLWWQRVLSALTRFLHCRSLTSRVTGRFEGAESGTTQATTEKLRCRESWAGPTRQWAAGPAPPPDRLWPMVSPLAPHTLLTEGREDSIGLWNNNINICIQRRTYSTWEMEEILPRLPQPFLFYGVLSERWETIQTGWPLQVSALEMPLWEALWAKIDRFVPSNTHALWQGGRALPAPRAGVSWIEMCSLQTGSCPLRGWKYPLLFFNIDPQGKKTHLNTFQWIMKRFI